MVKKKKVDAALSAERAYQARKSHANRSNWQEHAIFIAADTLAARHHSDPSKFRHGVASYRAFGNKKRFHKEIAERTKAILRTEADERVGPTFTNLDTVTEEAVRKMLLRRRSLFETMFAERRAAIAKAFPPKPSD